MSSTQQLSSQQPFEQSLPNTALAGIPEDEVVEIQKIKKVVKKKKRRMIKRRSGKHQPGGMTDQEKSVWLLEHCKVKQF